MTDLYTNTPMTQRMDQARSVFGDNPADVARGIAGNMTNSPTFQEPLQDQKNALGAMQEIAAYDQQLGQKFQQGNQNATQQIQGNNAMLSNFASAGATPQETIAKGQQAMPATGYQTSFNGILSPFVPSGLASGQQQAATDVFNMASQTRAALEKTVGTEAQAYAEALRYALAQEQYEAERQRQLEQDKKASEAAEFERQLELIKMTGGSIYNPYDGKTYTIPAPEGANSGSFDIQSALSNLRGGTVQGSGITTDYAINPTNANQSFYRPPIESFEIEPAQSFNAPQTFGDTAKNLSMWNPLLGIPLATNKYLAQPLISALAGKQKNSSW